MSLAAPLLASVAERRPPQSTPPASPPAGGTPPAPPEETGEHYRRIVELSPDAILIHRGGRILFANRKAADLLGAGTPGQLAGCLLLDHFHSQDRALLEQQLCLIEAGTLPGPGEPRGRTGGSSESPPGRYQVRLNAAGDERWVELTLVAIEYGGRAASLSTAVDITGRRRAEKLQAAVYQIAQAVDQVSSLDELYGRIHAIIGQVMPAGNFYIALYDRQQNLVTFPYFVDEVDVPSPPGPPGHGLTEYVLRTGRSLLCTEDVDAQLKQAGEVEVVGVPCPIWLGVPLRVEDETIGVMAVQHYSDPDAYGEREQRMLEFVSAQVAQAINRKAAMLARLRAEEARTASESRYRNLFEHAPVGIYRMTPDGWIVAANPALVQMLGYSSFEELAAVNLEQESGNSGLRYARFKEHLEKHGHIHGLETAWRTRGGDYIFVRENAQAVRGPDGAILYYDGTVEDITDRKRAEAENARLLAETRRRADEFGLLYETARDLATPQNLPLQLQAIVERAGLLLHAPSAFIYLYDAASDEVVLTVEKGRQMRPGIRLAAGEGAAGRVAVSHQPLIIDNYQAWPFRSSKHDGLPYGPILQVPMLAGGELVGVLGVSDLPSSERHFTKDDAEILSLFAGQAAGAVRGARLFAETERRAHEFAALYETAQDLANMQDLPGMLDLVLTRATALLSAGAGFIYLYDPAHGEIELTVEKGGLVTPGARLALGEGIAGRIAETRRPMVVNDYHESELRSPKFLGLPLAALIGVPMLQRGELIGVLGVAELGPSTRRFASDDAQLLTLFAEEAASAVGNARLLHETRARAQQLALLYDAGLTLNSVLEPTAQLEFLFKIAMRALRADRAEFFRCEGAAGELVLELGVGYPEEGEAAQPVRFSVAEQRTPPGWVYQNRVPLNVPDLSAEPRLAPVDPALRSGLWVPVEHQGELRGVLDVLSTRPGAFSPQDERLLILFANQAAVALENARLYTAARGELAERRRVEEALREKIRTLQTLAEIDREVMASRGTQEVMSLVCARTAELLHAPGGVVGVQAENGLEVVASHGVAAESCAPVEVDWSRLDRAAGASSVELIPAGDPRLALFDPRAGIRSIAHAMLMSTDRPVGLLAALDTAPRAWSADDLELLNLLAGQAAIALDKTRLVQQLEESLSMTTRLYRLTGQVLLATTFDETARLITETLQEGMAADLTSLMLLDDQGRMTFRYGVGFPDSFPAGEPPRADGITMKAWRTGEPVTVEEPSVLNPNLTALGVRCGIAIPLPGDPRPLGVLFVDYCRPHEFSEREVRLVSLFANHAALALRHVRLLDETRHRADQLALVNQIAAAINQPASLSEVLKRTLNELGRVLHTDSGAVAIFRGMEQSLTLIADYDPDGGPSMVGRTIALKDNPSMQYLLRERRPLAVPDASDPAILGEITARELAASGVQSMLLLPLVVENRLIGTVGLDSKKRRRVFRPDEIALAETLAHYAAAAIEKARLYDETRQRADELAALNRIASTASQTRSLDSLLATVYDEVRRTFQVDGFFIALYDEEKQELDFRVRVDDTQQLPPGRIPLEAAPLTAYTLAGRKAVLIRDLAGSEEEVPSPVFFGDSEETPRSWVGIPLQIGSKIIGILSIQSYRPNAYDETQKQLLETIAGQVAVAIENARLFDERQ